MLEIHSEVLKTFDALPDDARVRIPVAMALFGVSKATYWRWVYEGRIERPTPFGGISSTSAGAIRRTLAQIAAQPAVPRGNNLPKRIKQTVRHAS
jgi:hypothetical protein